LNFDDLNQFEHFMKNMAIVGGSLSVRRVRRWRVFDARMPKMLNLGTKLPQHTKGRDVLGVDGRPFGGRTLALLHKRRSGRDGAPAHMREVYTA
jgi:ribulose 1,5-bisphosphate carboxylase large subunit-like protein